VVDAASWAFSFRPYRLGPTRWEYGFYDGETRVLSAAGPTEALALEALLQLLRERECHPDAIEIVAARLSALRYDA
jgi:hypothetical protein